MALMMFLTLHYPYGQIAAGEASHLLNRVAAGEGLSWDDIRSELAAHYDRAGVSISAALVRTL
jgi:hypothetical protein